MAPVRTVPDDWVLRPISELVRTTSQRDPRSEQDASFVYIDVSSIDNRLFTISETTPLTGACAPSRARKLVQTNDVIVATVRPTLKRIALVSPELDGEIASTAFCVLRADEHLLKSEYLFYRTLSREFRDEMERLQRGANYPAVRDGDVRGVIMPLPPLSEQQSIVHVLSTLHETMIRQSRLLAATRELKAALARLYFTEGVTGEPRQLTSVGSVPASWSMTTVNKVLKFASGKVRPRDTEATPSPTKPIPVFGGNGILGYTSDALVHEATVIVGRVGAYCGCAYFSSGDAWITDNALYAKTVDDAVDARYLSEYFNYRDLNRYSARAGQPLITQGAIGQIEIPLPPVAEQHEIAYRLSVVDRSVELHLARLYELTALFHRAVDALTTGETRLSRSKGVTREAAPAAAG